MGYFSNLDITNKEESYSEEDILSQEPTNEEDYNRISGYDCFTKYLGLAIVRPKPLSDGE